MSERPSSPARPNPRDGARGPWASLATVAAWVAVWELASLAVGNPILLAGPLDTLSCLAGLVVTPVFWTTMAGSLARIALGFATGFVAALALGVTGQRWPWVARLVSPALSFLKSVPIVCVIVLLLIWVGSRRVSAIVVFLAVFPAVYFSVAEGLAQADRQVDQMLRTFGVGAGRRLMANGWPSLVPYLVATSRNVCGMAWKAGVAAEVIGSPLGTIGWNVYQAKILLETDSLFAWTIAIVVASWACERGFLALLAASARWARWLSLAGLREGARPEGGANPCQPGAIRLGGAAIGHGDAAVASGLAWDLPAGGRAVLADPSGTGKTTLLATLEGLLVPLTGTVQAPQPLSAVFQEARLVEGMTAEENVALAAGGALGLAQARDLLAELLPEDALGRPVSALSGGQRRRVELARALAHPSAAVLLDEPFASLDEASHRTTAAFVTRHLDGRTLLVASHLPGDAGLLGATEVTLDSMAGQPSLGQE